MATPALRQLTKREAAIVGKYAAKHGQVLRAAMQIADSDGRIGVPLVRLSTLARLEHKGVITAEEAAAGERFNRLFQRAGLDGLQAADMARVPVAGGPMFGDVSASGERCRRRIADAVTALGGHGSIAASAVWHVVGLEWSVRRWSISARRPDPQAAGILIGALAVLAAHFNGRR